MSPTDAVSHNRGEGASHARSRREGFVSGSGSPGRGALRSPSHNRRSSVPTSVVAWARRGRMGGVYPHLEGLSSVDVIGCFRHLTATGSSHSPRHHQSRRSHKKALEGPDHPSAYGSSPRLPTRLAASRRDQPAGTCSARARLLCGPSHWPAPTLKSCQHAVVNTYLSRIPRRIPLRLKNYSVSGILRAGHSGRPSS